MGTRNDGAPGKAHRQAALAALRSVPAPWTLVFDLELQLVLAAGDALAEVGLREPACEGAPLAELLSADSWSRWRPLFEAATRGTPRTIDIAGAVRSRSYRVDVGPWHGADGAIVGGVALARDIGDLLLRSEQRAAALQAANRELEAFNYSVSHDLRAPLRAIDGFSAAVARRNSHQLDDAGREMLERIRKSVVRMGALIDALLVLSRLSRREMRHERVDLSELAWEVADELRAREPHRSVDLSIEEGLCATGDRELLRIVVENLIGNAWKFTAEREQARIEFCGGGHNGRPELVVRDNGAGFDMAYVDRLFAPFGRLHPEEEFAGLGIGLATVQRIVRRHGGAIRGEGAVGEGAAFHFDLDPTAEERG
jgi:light-regulated signal transduction histidine kinase (bacteriophytochrome)